MAIGNQRIKDIMFERFTDALNDALRQVNKDGRVIYVDNSITGASDTFSGERISSPMATIDAAIGRTTANRGDTIIVGPRHAETVIAAGGIALDVANVNVIGLNVAGQKPMITFGTVTTASWLTTASGCKIKGIVGTTSLDAMANPFNFTSVNDCEVDIEWRANTAAIEAARAILMTTCNRMDVKLKYRGFTTGDAVVNAIRLNDCDHVDIDIDAFGVVGALGWIEMVTASIAGS